MTGTYEEEAKIHILMKIKLIRKKLTNDQANK